MKSICLLLLIVVVVPFGGRSQTLVSELKKKYFGNYSGEIPSYKILSDTSSITVSEVDVAIKLNGNNVVKRVGRLEQHGTYTVLFKDKSYYVLELSFGKDPLIEKWMLKEKTKELFREGGMSQPTVRLKYRGK